MYRVLFLLVSTLCLGAQALRLRGVPSHRRLFDFKSEHDSSGFLPYIGKQAPALPALAAKDIKEMYTCSKKAPGEARFLELMTTQALQREGSSAALRFIDVGAHVGRYTTDLLKSLPANVRAAGVTGSLQVEAFVFEPHPEIFHRYLVPNLEAELNSIEGSLRSAGMELRHQVVPFQEAVGEMTGRVMLHSQAYSPGRPLEQSSLDAASHGFLAKSTGKKTTTFPVAVRCLDEFFQVPLRHNRRSDIENRVNKFRQESSQYVKQGGWHDGVIDILKIDTEGHDLRVLEGAETFRASNKVRIVQMEFLAYFGTSIRHRSPVAEVSLLEALGYEVYALFPRNLVSMSLAKSTFDEGVINDQLCSILIAFNKRHEGWQELVQKYNKDL